MEKHLTALIEKGYLRKGPGKRTLEMLSQNSRVSAAESKSLVPPIPILGRIAAGRPILAEENLLGHLTVDPPLARLREAFFLKVEGRSMTGAGIFNGDLVLVKP